MRSRACSGIMTQLPQRMQRQGSNNPVPSVGRGWWRPRATARLEMERCRRASSQTAAPGGRLRGGCGRPLEAGCGEW